MSTFGGFGEDDDGMMPGFADSKREHAFDDFAN